MKRIDFIRALFFPPLCPGCGKLLDILQSDDIGAGLCKPCRHAWEEGEGALCADCGKPAIACRCQPQPLRAAGCHTLIALALYCPWRPASPVNRTVLKLKDAKVPVVTAFLAKRLASVLQPELAAPECISAIVTYLPRRAVSVRHTGLDQSEELSKALARELSLPWVKCFSRRSGRREQKKQKNVKERLKNAKSLFKLAPSVSVDKQTVIVVDDVVTTGGSMSGAVALLKNASAVRVIGAALTRTEKQTPSTT